MESKLSVVVLTHNDELRIVDCLDCLKFADEIVIIDDNSKDRTVELAKQFTDKIFIHDLENNFANQRNFALNHVRNNWVLFIDSDEVVTDKLQAEIIEAIDKNHYAGYYLKRFDYMWGKRILHGEVGQVKLLRLARKNTGKWHGKVHEVWEVKGDTKELKYPLIHVPHQSIFEFVADVDRYSTLRANELREHGAHASFFSILVYPIGKFILNYFFKKGYKDNIPGFLYAAMMSFHSFLVRGKLFLIQND